MVVKCVFFVIFLVMNLINLLLKFCLICCFLCGLESCIRLYFVCNYKGWFILKWDLLRWGYCFNEFFLIVNWVFLVFNLMWFCKMRIWMFFLWYVSVWKRLIGVVLFVKVCIGFLEMFGERNSYMCSLMRIVWLWIC